MTNLGRPGWTSAQLLSALRSDDRFRAAVSRADVVTWDIGGNDIIRAAVRASTRTCGGPDGLRCMRTVAGDFEREWTAIVDELIELRASRKVALYTFDLYSPFIPPGAYSGVLVEQLRSMNVVIRATHRRDGVEVAAVAEAFSRTTDPLISGDGLHPSARGHRRIAAALLDLGLPSGR